MVTSIEAAAGRSSTKGAKAAELTLGLHVLRIQWFSRQWAPGRSRTWRHAGPRFRS